MNNFWDTLLVFSFISDPKGTVKGVRKGILTFFIICLIALEIEDFKNGNPILLITVALTIVAFAVKRYCDKKTKPRRK
ncbi:MAG: hypothetical protein LBS69_00890 [Prevotellaceae bacterium]|jgi:hypothetical protein|nr:hypothetical protein [Prevotellaceae bacterium]